MLDDTAKKELRDLLGDAVLFDEPLAPYTSFRIGGPADVMAAPRSQEQLMALLQWAAREGLPYFILGGGTNLLVRDGGFSGMVLRLQNMPGEVKWSYEKDHLVLTAGLGLPTRRLCRLALHNGWRGLNNRYFLIYILIGNHLKIIIGRPVDDNRIHHRKSPQTEMYDGAALPCVPRLCGNLPYLRQLLIIFGCNQLDFCTDPRPVGSVIANALYFEPIASAQYILINKRLMIIAGNRQIQVAVILLISPRDTERIAAMKEKGLR